MSVEVWWATPRPGLEHLLTGAERAHAARLRHAADRLGHVTGRALARTVLAARTGVGPTDLHLTAVCRTCGGPHGKLRLTGPAGVPPLAFSLARAPGLVVLAVVARGEVGVDVEGEDPPDRLATLALAEPERGSLAALPARQRPRALAAAWTRKEAVLKATGHGLAVAPSRVILGGDRSVRAPGGAAVALRDLHPPPGYVGAVAVVGGARLHVVERAGDELLRRGAA